MILTILLLTAIIGFILIWTHTQPDDDPPGARIRRNSYWGWNYTLEDTRGMVGTGYLTRASAIRAAQDELDRLAQKDEATQ